MAGKLLLRRRPDTATWSQRLVASIPWLILLGVLAVRIWSSQHSGLMYDEPVTLHIARSVAAGQLPFADFFEHHSPLPWYVLAPLASTSLWRVQRLLIALAGALALTGLFRLSRLAWGERAATIAVVLGAVSPLWHRQGNMLIHDSFLVIALTGALFGWWHALRRPTPRHWLLAGFCAGLVVLCKQTGAASALALGLGVLCFSRSARAVAAYVLGGLLTCIPLLFLYRGQYDTLFQGLLGWNLAANMYLTPNLKLKPFLNDIFWANPVLWMAGTVTALLTLRHLRRRFDGGDPRPLSAVAALIVILVLVFNWFLSRQTFGQYYLQAVPPLILLAAQGLEALSRRPIPSLGQATLGLVIVYLGILNPLMNALTPWTPDLQEKLAIARWLHQEVEDEVLWEPWVYYAYLVEKEFTFFYPFLSIHSMRDDPALPFINGKNFIHLESYLDTADVQWVVVHDPLLPGVRARLDRIFTAGPDDWQVIRSFRVTRYASEGGYQRHLWTPWWKPVVYYETVTVWRRHPRPRQGGLVGELTIRNPTGQRYLFLEVLHPGGQDVYRLDEASTVGKQYVLRWHQTGHAFFLGDDYLLIDHQSEQEWPDVMMITVAFSDSHDRLYQDIYQVRLPSDTAGRFCADCAETWQCLGWGTLSGSCERADVSDVLNLTSTAYKPLREGEIDGTTTEQ